MFKLPTRSERRYRGKYPYRVHSIGYGQSESQKALAAYLGIRRPTHIELNNGERYIMDRLEFADLSIGKDMWVLYEEIEVHELTDEQYADMIKLIRRVREKGLT